MKTKFENFLDTFDEKDWVNVLNELLPSIHEVDRDAVQIWFRFYPLQLFRYLQKSANPAADIQKFVLQGDWELKNQIDKSHRFFYGHRYWKATKKVIVERSETFDLGNVEFSTEVKQLAQSIANETKAGTSLTLAITLVGLMTLVQSGLDAFKATVGEVGNSETRSPEKVVAERAKDDSQGLFGFLKTIDKKYTVKFDSGTKNGEFKAVLGQDITTGSMTSNVKTDDRCFEGPIPVECKSAACGTCWVGIIGGKDRLKPVSILEEKQVKAFGYNAPEGTNPPLRLACQAKVLGNVSVVIPPWNGNFGREVYGIAEVELEPATTSAKKLRETIAESLGNEVR